MSNYVRATALLAAVLLAACESPVDLDTPAGLSPAEMSASLTELPVMVGVTGGPMVGPSSLYAIDPATGESHLIGEIGYFVTGLEYDPVDEKLYGATWYQDPSGFNGLIEIDLATGAGTPIGTGWDFQLLDVTAITADPSGGLVGWQESFGDFVVEIDEVTGTAFHTVGPSGVDLSDPALEFGPEGRLWLVDGANVYGVDRATAAVALARTLRTAAAQTVAAEHGTVDPASGKYYGLSAVNAPGNLVIADLGTGAAEVGPALAPPFYAITFVRATPPANQPPVANAGPDRTVECTCGDDGTTTVTLDGTGSGDPDGAVVSWTWTDASGAAVATGATPTVALGCGTVTLTLTVTDDAGATATDEVVIDIVDTTAPAIHFPLEQTTLWSPNHEMVVVATGISATDACDPDVLVKVVVTSDQPLNGTGDGDTDWDWEVLDHGDGTFDVAVRAERAATLGDRTYTITVTATDDAGNVTTDQDFVYVPLSQ